MLELNRIPFLCAVVLSAGLNGAASAAVMGQWDFNGNNLSATVGTALAYRGDTAATTTFPTATIGGSTANVMSFPATTPMQGYMMTHGIAPNGGGLYVNQYTLIMDIMFPPASSGNWRVLFQTNPANSNDGEFFVNPDDGIGISGAYHGSILPNTWHRVAFVVDLTLPTQRLRKFIDGALVGTQDLSDGVDGRWALEPTALLFADEDNEAQMGFVNSVQIRSEAMLDGDVAALGGATAAGIPMPAAPSSLHVVTPNGGENYQAGSSPTLAWTVANPSGLVQIELYRGGALFQILAQVGLNQSNYVWAINPSLGDTNNYRIKLTAVSYPAVTDSSDNDFSVFGSVPGPNPLFGQALQTNGGFELLFANWQTIAGSPLVLTSVGGKGDPHAGVNFFHGGINTAASNAIVRQDIDLIATGFTTNDLDSGAVLDAEAWLRNFYGAGTFDDQVFYRVGYLDGANQELSAVRCIIAANSVWLQRNLAGRLPAGTRKLRLEIVGKHRRDADNDSMADDLIVRLQKPFPLPTPNITKLPMLQDVRTDAMTLIWETDGNLANHYVDWGRSNITEHTLSQIETLQIDASHFVHRATIPGLATETEYVYRVRSGANATATYAFITAPKRSSPFVTAWWGDNHAGTVTLAKHVTNLLAHAPNMICVAGDMVNSGNAIAEWHNYWFKPLETLNAAQTTPVIYARGNHDGEHALAYAYSTLPGNEAWFAFDYGNSRFIFLDSEVPTSTASDQYAWLQAELSRPETQQAAFRIVCFHRPPYCNVWNGGGYIGETFVRTDWVPLFTQKNVDIVISGHQHSYQRGATNGVVYIVSGGGGGTIDTEIVADWPFVQVEWSKYHFDIMEVNGPVLSWETFDDNNEVLDMFTLQSRVPVLSWETVVPVGGQLKLGVAGKPGTSYVLESSTNLVNWTSLVTNTIPLAGSPMFTNSVMVTVPGRSFRARAMP
ncbi:MAG: metallophosphoesterase [Verrucomicrobiota bacterium]